MRVSRVLSLSLCLLAAAVSAAAQENLDKEIRAYRISGSPPLLDGRIDEEVWVVADSIDDFTQQEPDNMAAPNERTVVQVAYDDRYLYIAARCYTEDPATITDALGRRGSIPASDTIGIAFDPRHDHLTAYHFVANPSGVQSDSTFFNDTREDHDYEAVWEVATAVTKEGWNAEFRIPFSQIRFATPGGEETIWGFQVRREVQKTGEWAMWNAAPRGTQGVVSRFGHLIFDQPITPPRRLELLPFGVFRSEYDVEDGRSRGADAGLDLRLGLGTSATLAATINPDFGQVELDPAVLNLSVFETFYPEKRPFFLEDSRVFVLPYGQFPLFHSRRIGRTPGRFDLAEGEELISKPDQTTILGAAKVTGKASGWTYGGLTALTAREYATVETTATNADGSELVSHGRRLIEPLTMYGVGRVQRDVLDGTSNIGAIATAVVREKDLDAFTGGGDYNIRWDRNLYTVNGHWVASHAPIDGLHRNGFAGLTNFDYGGKHLGYSAHVDHISEHFRNTDLGFLNGRVDKTNVSGGVRASQPDPWKFLRDVDLGFYTNRQWNGDGLLLNQSVEGWGGMQLKNYWRFNFGGTQSFRAYDDLDTRGGPPIVDPARTYYRLNVNSDSRKQWGVGFNVNGNRDAEGAWQRNLNASLRLQPSGRVQATVSTGYTRAEDVAQWIENSDADADGIEDHVYGRLRRNVVNITARGTYAFSRDMTLQVFLQPFVAAGDYHDIRKLARPSSFDFTPVSLEGNPDFNRKSLRGNIVLRWEYVRGSTLFVVWNMATSDESRAGDFSPKRDLRTAFGAPGNHVFVVKMNYWLSL
jgi:hypothetical protein